MNILTTTLIVIAALITLFLLIAAFTKKSFALSKQVLINSPKEDVFNYIKLIRNQEYYSVWVMRDPNIQIIYTGTDGTPGFTSSWTSNDKNVGVGAQEIKEINQGQSMKVEIRFEKPFKATNYALNEVSSTTDGRTLMTQTFTGTSKFPMNIMNLFMDKLVGKDMQTNLQNLKTILEKN